MTPSTSGGVCPASPAGGTDETDSHRRSRRARSRRRRRRGRRPAGGSAERTRQRRPAASPSARPAPSKPRPTRPRSSSASRRMRRTRRTRSPQNGERLRRVIDALRKAGVAKDDLRTSNVSLWPQRDNDGMVHHAVSGAEHRLGRARRREGRRRDRRRRRRGRERRRSGPSLSVGDRDALYREGARERRRGRSREGRGDRGRGGRQGRSRDRRRRVRRLPGAVADAVRDAGRRRSRVDSDRAGEAGDRGDRHGDVRARLGAADASAARSKWRAISSPALRTCSTIRRRASSGSPRSIPERIAACCSTFSSSSRGVAAERRPREVAREAAVEVGDRRDQAPVRRGFEDRLVEEVVRLNPGARVLPVRHGPAARRGSSQSAGRAPPPREADGGRGR